ncbi:YbfB/YjiJ family MFS transporter [Pseudomonas sp. MWU13-2105]|uniref:YbfB/YjiJ family MFS transporter n=1 Tax=Pseudomonas sp. MWU13-2105 TaxID=2935074 RepID=UPI00200C4F7D|nr:YbfB/YjiJ family MFS transporter [Pseudomonas sp. MWU13-2105]
MSAATTATLPLRNDVWLHIFAGLCASLVSIGLARFAYTPLIPQLIQAHWFVATDVVYLGAANLAGYLIGALLGHPLGKRLSNPFVLRLMLLVATLSFFACAWPLSFSWFFAWRLLSGIAGGAIMVLVASTVLPHVPAARRGAASGAIFLGIGLGIAGSGTLVPALLEWGLRDTWIGLGLVAALLTAASWFCWPQSPPEPGVAVGASTAASHADQASNSGLRLLLAQYALMATGLVPAMVFLVDYVTRGLDAGPRVAALVWVMYGIGAIFGPMVYGMLADHLGARRSIRWVLIVQALTVATLSVASQPWLLCGLAVLIGSFPPGIVPLALARVHELKPHAHAQQVAWSRATVAFASFQALAGAAYSLIFNASGGHHQWLFMIASIALLLAIALDIATRRLR